MMRFLRLLLAFVAMPVFAQGGFDPATSVKLAFEKGAVVVTAPEGSHLKAAFMKVEKPEGPGAISLGALTPTNAVDELGDPIWHGTVRIPVKGEGLVGTVKLAVTYQPCTEGKGGVCYAPTTRELEVPASAIPGSKPAPAAPKEAPKPAQVEAPKAAAPIAPPVEAPAPAPVVRTPPPASAGLLWLLLQAFGFGILASLTPCVLPMIPITMAIIGAKGGGKGRGLALSLVLVLGMAVTYTVLGVVAARTGAAFGAAAQKPAFLVPVAILFAALALSLFGAFEIRLPSSLQERMQSSAARKGFGGAFFMGLILGPISAPCVGPFIGAQLIQIAQRGEVAIGGLTLFVFALGMGVLFVVSGTAIAALPKSGDWLTRLKQIMGLVILSFAAWTLRYILPGWANLAAWSCLNLVGAAVFGVFEPAQGMLSTLRRALAILYLASGVLLGLRAIEAGFDVRLLPGGGATVTQSIPSTAWMSQDLEGALAKARAEHKVVLVDIYAKWCAQCHELDEKTWPDPQVQAWIAANAIAVRIDTDAERKDLAAKLKIGSYPTVLVLDADGAEKKRSLGFQPPADMLAWLKN